MIQKGIEVIYDAPAQMAWQERLFLYALVYGLRPQNCLEIGTAQGGSAMIICRALDMWGSGKLVCIDPVPQIAPEHWAQIAHRVTLVKGMSPQALPEAFRIAGSPFDFVFIDGNHTYECVLQDIEGVLPFLKDDSYLLLHDAHYFGVQEALTEATKRYPALIDCGLVVIGPHYTDEYHNGKRVVWGGFQLLRYKPSGDRPWVQGLFYRSLARLREKLKLSRLAR